MTKAPQSTISPTKPKSKWLIASIIWPIVGAVGILLLVVTSILTLSLGQNEASMIRLLTGEGGALIHAVEGAVRISVRRRSPVQLQRTLEELVSADVRFISVVMPEGIILAHNNSERTGSFLEVNGQEVNEKLLQELSNPVENSSLRWFIAEVDGKQTFVIYRDFMLSMTNHEPPSPRPNPWMQQRNQNLQGSAPPPRKGGLGPRQKIKRPLNTPPMLIFLGLDISPYELGQRHDRIYLFSLAGGIALAGAALLLAMYYALRAQESRRRQAFAEGQVRELEEEMSRKEKLAAIGNLAAGVAHEIRNPLSSIKGYATYFGQRFPEGSEDRQAAGVMVREVERLNRVITDLIGLSRPTDVHAKPTQILTVVEHALQLLRQDAEQKRIYFHIQRPKRPLPLVLLDVDRFGQALLNICLNAIEAMPQGGEVHFSFTVHAAKFLALEIKDNGIGIEEQHLVHIFDPYFTTKGQGTGLGLATVHKIVEAHGGEISVTSNTKNTSKMIDMHKSGTTFRILLPLAHEKGEI